jgi:hypothetical protein
MTKVNQKISDPQVGDCMRASVASLLDLPIEAVPHFLLSGELYHDVYVSFFWAHGWEYIGNISGGVDPCELKEDQSINGYFPASVQSYLFNGNTHAVIMDCNGVIVHDPSPSKHYNGRKVYGTKELLSWRGFKARDDGWRDYSHVKKYLAS